MITKDEAWLLRQIAAFDNSADGAMMCKLAASVFLAARTGTPFRPLPNMPLDAQYAMIRSRFECLNSDSEQAHVRK